MPLTPLRLLPVLALLAATADAASKPLTEMETSDWTVEVVAEDLDYPWDIEGSGERIFATEKPGRIVAVHNGVLTRSGLSTSEPILDHGGGGLLGMALAADFADTGTAYLYHTYGSPAEPLNRVVEARFDGEAWRETRVLLDAIPGHRLYNGGRLLLGPDGHLYVSTGWTEDGDLPQDPHSLAGKILRMTVDGAVPGDNPRPGSYVYSLGHRNPQGLAWGPDGRLFVVEHGQSGDDEVNLVRPGGNYGWPLAEGDEASDGMEPPLVHSGGETWAPSGAAVVGDVLVVASLRDRGLYALDEAGAALKPVFTSRDRIRDVVSVNGDLYVVTTNRSPRQEGASSDRMLRLLPRK